ncbi:MAG: Pilus assembly protein PilP [Pseudomonadota bacterium]
MTRVRDWRIRLLHAMQGGAGFWRVALMLTLLEIMLLLGLCLPRQQILMALQDEITVLRQDMTALLAEDGAGQALEQAASRYADALAFWPAAIMPARWMSEAAGWARASAVSLEHLHPDRERDHGDYAVTSLDLALHGSFAGITRFLAHMLTHADHAGLASLKLQSRHDGQLDLEAVVELRHEQMLRPLGLARRLDRNDPAPWIRQLALRLESQRDPFHDVIHAADALAGEGDSPLLQLDPRHLVLRGSLSGAGTAWGILQAGDGQLYQVSRGDLLGQPAWRVSMVLAHEVVLESTHHAASAAPELLRIHGMQQKAAAHGSAP